MNKFKSLLCLLLSISLIGCSTSSEQDSAEIKSTFVATELPETDNAYEDYANHLLIVKSANSYTTGVKNNYVLTYSDESSAEYSFDGILEVENANNNPTAHLTEYINGNGLQSTVEGYYYDGRLYNNYNGVTYYEDMDYTALLAVLQTPVTLLSIKDDEMSNIEKNTDNDEITFKISLTDDASYNYFLNHYDVSGISSYENVIVTNGVIEQTFNSLGYFIKESASFNVSLVVDDQTVGVVYSSTVSNIKFDETTVSIDDTQKLEQAEYVAFEDIDVDSISDSNVEDDAPGETIIETFKKRLVNRLNYSVQDDGTYVTNYNDNESYTVDFENHQFTYTNYSSKYVYNWQGDTGVFGTYCTYDFNTEQSSNDCDSDVLEMIKNVKEYFQLELYYCGLSLDELLNE